MPSVIDIDLDYLMNETIYHPFGENDAGSRRDWNEYGTWWTLNGLLTAVESLGASVKDLPKVKVERHDEVLRAWEAFLQSGVLSSPFGIIHFDAHSDLYRRPSHPAQSVPDETNFLWWAIYRGWVADITWVVPDPQLARIWTSKGLSGSGITPAGQAHSGGMAMSGPRLPCPSEWTLSLQDREIPLHVVAARHLRRIVDARCITLARSPSYTCESLDIEYEGFAGEKQV